MHVKEQLQFLKIKIFSFVLVICTLQELIYHKVKISWIKNLFPIIPIIKTCRKYHVTKADAQFVHAFKKQGKIYVICMSGICHHGYGKNHKLQSIYQHQNFSIWIYSTCLWAQMKSVFGLLFLFLVKYN